MSKQQDHCAHVAAYFVNKSAWWVERLEGAVFRFGFSSASTYLIQANKELSKAKRYARRCGMPLEGGAA